MLPDKEFISLIKDAAKLNKIGINIPREKPDASKPQVLETPEYLQQALNRNPKVKAIFEVKSNSFRKE